MRYYMVMKYIQYKQFMRLKLIVLCSECDWEKKLKKPDETGISDNQPHMIDYA